MKVAVVAATDESDILADGTRHLASRETDANKKDTSSTPYIEIYTPSFLHPFNCRFIFLLVNTLRCNLVHTAPPSSTKVVTYAIPCAS